jgi:hypothetical protein
MSTSQNLVGQAPKTGPWIIGYVLSISATFFVIGRGLVSDPQLAVLFWIPVLVSVAMIVYTSWKRHRLLGTLSGAARKFWRRIVCSSALMFSGYILNAAVWQAYGAIRPWIELSAFLPYIGFAGMIWSVHQYIVDEEDEYLRAQAIRQALTASFVSLIAAAIWGGLAHAHLLPPGWVGFGILLWFGGLGVGRLYVEMRP